MKTFRLLLAFLLAMGGLAAERALAQAPVMPPGAGTEGDPYRVSTLSHLAWMSTNGTGTYASAFYSLQNDIDASATTNWYGGAGFMPIGKLSPFSGKFAGNGHAIGKLAIHRPAEDYVGLFGVAVGAVISGVALADCQVSGSAYVGGVVGYSFSSTVSACRVSGAVSGSSSVGGLVGYGFGGGVSGSHAEGTVSGGDDAGGLVGYSYGTTVTGSYASEAVSGNLIVGGLIGNSFGGAAGGCYAVGAVSGASSVGGLVGFNFGGTMTDSYAAGPVSGSGYSIGGLIGYNRGIVSGCYSVGAVSGGATVGGLIGENFNGSVSASYWDTNTSGCAVSAGGTGKSTAEMTLAPTFEGWNFASTWNLGGASYPHLRAFPAFELIYNAGLNGSVAGWPYQVVNIACGGLPCTAVPDTGYHFTGWSDGLAAAVRVDSNRLEELKVEAQFAINVITVLTDRASVTVPEGGSTNFQVRLSAQPVTDVEIKVMRSGGDKSIQVTGGSFLAFTPSDWAVYQPVELSASEDDSDNVNGSAPIICSGKEMAGAEVTATEADDDYTLAVSASFGTVTRAPDRTYYDGGSAVLLTAVPGMSYFFLAWSGDRTGPTNLLSLTMDGNKTVTAHFGPLAPRPLPPRSIGKRSFTARWEWVEGGAPEGELCVASNALFTQLVPGYEARYVANGTEGAVTNLPAGRDYWYRVRRLGPGAGIGPWSGPVKVRTGKGMPVFKNLLSEAPASKGVAQAFALSNLVSGAGVLKVKSGNTNAVTVALTGDTLTLRYLWAATNSTTVTLTLTHPATGRKSAYAVALARATGSVAVVSQSSLTNAGTRVAEELTLENRTGGLVYGLRVKAQGLDQAGWLINRTGLDPVSRAAILELPCVLPAGSQLVVRLVYNTAYAAQAASRPAAYGAWAVLTPVQGARPVTGEMTMIRQDPYDGLWLLGCPVNRNRLYAVYQSDDAGASWTSAPPVIRATGNALMWLDPDAGAPDGRLYRVVDAGM